jgi:hypothetical protein
MEPTTLIVVGVIFIATVIRQNGLAVTEIRVNEKPPVGVMKDRGGARRKTKVTQVITK